MENKMNIYQKIIEVRKMVEFLQKDTQGYQYRYVSGSNVLSSIRPKMDELGLILTTDIIDPTQERFQWEGTAVGKDLKAYPKTFIQFVTKFKMRMTWVNAEAPEEKFSQDWFSSGEDEDPAKSDGKGHTYGERYYLLKFFNIPTDNEDPDAFQRKQDSKALKAIQFALEEPTDITDAQADALKKIATTKFKGIVDFNAWLKDQYAITYASFIPKENFEKIKKDLNALPNKTV